MKYPFLKEETFDLRHQITFHGDEMKIYIPSYFFESNMSATIGEYIESLGLFWFETNGKKYELKLPIKIMFGFSDRKKETLKVIPDGKRMEYDIFILNDGDAFLYDINHEQSVSDLEFVFDKLLTGGRLPSTISYNDALDIILQTLLVSGKNDQLGVSSLTIELILAELYRNKRNTGEPFRFAANKDTTGPYDYKMVRITKLPELNSTFTGLGGEDTNEQIISAVYKTRSNHKEKETPIEKLLKY